MRFHQGASHLRRKIAMLKKSFATLKLGGAKRIYQHPAGPKRSGLFEVAVSLTYVPRTLAPSSPGNWAAVVHQLLC